MRRHTRLLPRLAVMASAGLLIAAAFSCGPDRSPAAPRLAVSRCMPGPDIATGIGMDWVGVPCPLDDALPLAPGIFTGWSEDDCLWSEVQTDQDQDGVDDSCERATAAAFAPMLVFASQDCNWDHGLGRMGGEYYYAVESTIYHDQAGHPTNRVLRIAYLMAYYRDCGHSQSVPAGYDLDPPHTGDSEFAIIDVAYDTTSHHWRTQRGFLSAHCGKFLDHCQWYEPPAFQYWVDERPLGAPYIWVSRGKHANYPSEADCDIEILDIPVEDCEYDSPQRFPAAYVQQNIGSRAFPLRDCDVPFSGSTLVDHTVVECMWSYRLNTEEPPRGRFNGWQPAVEGREVKPYGRILSEYAGF